MTIDSRSLLSFLAMLAFTVVAAFAAPAYAKTAAAPTIDQLYAEPADQFAPGTELTFTLEGTPGGKASIRLTGIQRAIPLQEAESGVYEGSYTVRTRDRLSADSTMRATLRVRGKSAVKSQPLGGQGTPQAAAPAASGRTAVNLALANFTVAPVARIEPGTELKFTIIGSAGAHASFTIENIARDVPMREVKPGQYEGSYTVRSSDRFTAAPRITGTLEANGRSDRMRLAQPLVQSGPAAPAPATAPLSTLPLQILSHADNAQVPGGPVELRGRTAPGADVAITVQATAALAGSFGMSQQVVNETMRADQAGNFAVTFQSPLPVPGTRFDIAVIASKGGLTKETRLVLMQQR